MIRLFTDDAKKSSPFLLSKTKKEYSTIAVLSLKFLISCRYLQNEANNTKELGRCHKDSVIKWIVLRTTLLLANDGRFETQ